MSAEAIATRGLRAVILALLLLVPVAAIYSFVSGGIVDRAAGLPGAPYSAGQRVFEWQAAPPQPFTLPLPPPGLAMDARRLLKTECKEADGVRTCTTTERVLKPGEKPPLGEGTPKITPGNYIEPVPENPQEEASFYGLPVADRTFTLVAPPIAGARDVMFFARPGISLERLAGATALTTLWLILFLAILYNLERLLHTLEKDAIFSPPTVRRLQLVGLCVAGMAFLPQLDIFAMLSNAALALFGLGTAAPLPVAFPAEVNIALLLAGAFTILIARIVKEAARLADEVEGTV